MSWTDERVETLKKMWSDGLSASTIAGALGGGVTRNAVIGKVHRLGLSNRASKAPATTAPRRPKPTRAPSHPMVAVATTRGATALAVSFAPVAKTTPAPVEDLRPIEEVVIPISERVTIMDLRESMCRWPLGDPGHPDFRFCGGRSNPGVPYCAHHSQIAYQPAMDRRQRDRQAARV